MRASTVTLLCFATVAIACGGPSKTLMEPASVPPGSDASVSYGRDVFARSCNKCHQYPDPTAVDEGKWPSVLEEMGEKAKLTQADRDAVLKYIVAARHRPAQ